MASKSIRLTFNSPPHSTVLNGDDERLCCIQAENILRAWIGGGFKVDVAIACRTEDQAQRIAAYVADVARELASEGRLRESEEVKASGLFSKFLLP